MGRTWGFLELPGKRGRQLGTDRGDRPGGPRVLLAAGAAVQCTELLPWERCIPNTFSILEPSREPRAQERAPSFLG